MLAEKGVTAYRLAGMIDSTHYQIYRLTHGQSTSFGYLARLVPVFGLVAVANIITDQETRKAFIYWCPMPERPKSKSPRKSPNN
ncbi:hypothetical protein GCM10009733_103280 [Nonomuraea maheshkhaliensis]|uniref:Uncharacterized protein n=2 Tax=Nonomuraea maheshkhaliensis TaxID=419590 RepID=A0ABN2HMS3_9ACTN